MAEIPTFAAHGAAMPVLGLGTAVLKGQVIEAITETALGLGYNHIDTAAMYGNEVEIGRAIRAAGVARDAFWLTTKVWPDRHAPGEVQASTQESLERLGVDQVDLLLLHWPNFAVPLERTVEALNDCLTRGYTRFIGISNFTVALTERARSASAAPLLTDQVEYHPQLNQDKLLGYLREAGIALTAYSPLGRGAVLDEAPVQRAAEAHDKTPAQIVLRWHVQQPGVIAIPRTSNLARLAENLAVFDFALRDDEMAAISALARPDGRQIEVSGHTPAWD